MSSLWLQGHRSKGHGCRTQARAQERAGQRSAQERRIRGPHSRAAGRTALPRPSPLHLPRRPQVSTRRGAVTRHTS